MIGVPYEDFVTVNDGAVNVLYAEAGAGLVAAGNQLFSSGVTFGHYSGQIGFTETYMYWATTHMVQPASEALQCESFHGADSRLDWEALGYPGDPIEWGGRAK